MEKAVFASAVVGAVGSAGLMLRAGRHNSSRLLLVLFAGWVVAPYVALIWAYMASKRWPAASNISLFSTTLILTVVSLAIYATVAFGPPRAKTAPVFVIIPPLSCLLIAAIAAIAALRNRRSNYTGSRLE